MKKAILILLAIVMCVSLMACNMSEAGKKNTFIELKDNEVLNVGNSMQFMNYQDEREEIKTLTYDIDVTYNLRRTSYSSSEESIYYEGYYYSWNKSVRSENEQLGKSTTKFTYKYAYLPYGEDENIIVKKITHTQTSYDHEGGWVERETKVTIELNGYFDSFDEIMQKCPKLADKIDTRTKRQYYIDVTTPDSIQTTTEKYTNYYYIEEK